MKIIIQIILIQILCSCSTKIVIDYIYPKSKKELGKYILGLNPSAPKKAINADSPRTEKWLRSAVIARQINSSKHMVQWYINDGNPFNKSDILLPKYTLITIKAKGMGQSKIKIESYQRGLFFKSRQDNQQNYWARQIELHFYKAMQSETFKSPTIRNKTK